jgi:hypothetical protein
LKGTYTISHFNFNSRFQKFQSLILGSVDFAPLVRQSVMAGKAAHHMVDRKQRERKD